MSQPVAVGEFEGPMGLLLELVERGRMQVTGISVADITTKYLARLDSLPNRSPEELSEFVGLGARLLYIKSVALLPTPEIVTQPDELAILNRELDEYRTMQAAAGLLKNQAQTKTWQRSEGERLDTAELPVPNFRLDTLTEAFSRALAQLAPSAGKGIIMPHVTVERQSTRIIQRLKAGSFRLEELLDTCADRIEMVTTFLALLELMRTEKIQVSQDAAFGPVQIEVAHG